MGDKSKKIYRMKAHLFDHPNDYQTRVQLMKTESMQIEYEHRQSMIPKLKEISKIRQSLNKERSIYE